MKRTLLIILCIVVLLAAAGCARGILTGKAPSPEVSNETPVVDPIAASERVQVALYFSDWQALHVVPEFREIDNDGTNLAEKVVTELLAGPKEPHLYRTYPEDAKLIGVEVKEGIAYVNFKSGLNIAGSAGEVAAIYSLFLTLTDLPGVEKVQVLMDGRTDVSLGGHILLTEPMQRPGIVELAYPVMLDEERAKWLQEQSDKGLETWRTDPLEVAAKEGRMFGFDADTAFNLKEIKEGQIPAAYVTAEHHGEKYVIELVQPVKKGDTGVWMINGIETE